MATITRGFDGMSLALFNEMTPPPNTAGGGLANASPARPGLIRWVNQAFGTPLGIPAGIYLAEYGRSRCWRKSSALSTTFCFPPSIVVVGLFVHTIVVAQMQHFGWAGVIALALQLFIVIRTTENMLKLVPDSLREAAYALGTLKWKMIRRSP